MRCVVQDIMFLSGLSLDSFQKMVSGSTLYATRDATSGLANHAMR
jgi:hypothetical protein